MTGAGARGSARVADRVAAAPRPMRWALHLLVVILTVVAVVRGLDRDVPLPLVVAGVLLVAGATFIVLPGRPTSGDRTPALLAPALLALTLLAWGGLLALSPEAIWLAFPIFFLLLHALAPRWRMGAVAMALGAAILGWAHHHGFSPAAVAGPTLGALVAVATVLGYEALQRESDARQTLLEEVETTRGLMLAAEREAGVLAERERLARDIHDTITQGLTSIQFLLGAADDVLDADPGRARTHVRLAREAAVTNLGEARRLVQARPPDALAAGLGSALASALEMATAGRGIDARFRSDGAVDAHEPPEDVALALLRIGQSAIANAVEHAVRGGCG
ncbi:sensor histidine kinase [Janibacter sp. G1551]|uniref:sensor histidine kinase n=1 Tax=Janibacter sp. G1551 TaxID=3420440 RepID=UPI003CFD0C61